MSRQPIRTALVLALLALFIAPTCMIAGQKKPDPAPGEETAREALVKYDKVWKPSKNEPNFGDPRWKLKMETLVKLAKAGPAAIPLLESVAKEGSPWAPHSRQLATKVLETLRDNAGVSNAWANYDLSQMDIAKEGKTASDFALVDAERRTYRLSELRGKKTIVLTFVLQDI